MAHEYVFRDGFRLNNVVVKNINQAITGVGEDVLLTEKAVADYFNLYTKKLIATTTVYIGVSGKATMYLDNASAVNKGDGKVGLPCVGHSFVAGDPIKVIGGTASIYDNDDYTVHADTTTNEIVITATYAAETFSVSTVRVYYRQPITAAQAQALIDVIPKNLNGYNLMTQFYDGWYTFTNYLNWQDFIGGSLRIYGNSLDDSIANHKRVVIESSSSSTIRLSTDFSIILVYYIDARLTAGNSSSACFLFNGTAGTCGIRYCSTTCSGAGSGIRALYTPNVITEYNYFSGGSNAIYSDYASTISSGEGISNPSWLPTTGLRASRSFIFKAHANQPAGTASEAVTYGGLIRSIIDTDSSDQIGRTNLGYDGVNTDIATISHVDAPTKGIGVNSVGDVYSRGDLHIAPGRGIYNNAGSSFFSQSFYVSNSTAGGGVVGSDSNPGTSASPLLTINEAILRSSGACTVAIYLYKDQTYTLSSNINMYSTYCGFWTTGTGTNKPKIDFNNQCMRNYNGTIRMEYVDLEDDSQDASRMFSVNGSRTTFVLKSLNIKADGNPIFNCDAGVMEVILLNMHIESFGTTTGNPIYSITTPGMIIFNNSNVDYIDSKYVTPTLKTWL